jgi:beta-mannosidase
VRRALAPLALALRLAPGLARLAVLNGAPAHELKLTLRVLALDGRCLHEDQLAWAVPAHTSEERELPLPAFDEPVVGELRAFDASGAERARDCAWPEPFRFHSFAPVRPRFRLDGTTLHIEADAPLKGLWLEAAGTQFHDNFIDLMPQAPVTVALQGAPLGELRWVALDRPATQGKHSIV